MAGAIRPENHPNRMQIEIHRAGYKPANLFISFGGSESLWDDADKLTDELGLLATEAFRDLLRCRGPWPRIEQ